MEIDGFFFAFCMGLKNIPTSLFALRLVKYFFSKGFLMSRTSLIKNKRKCRKIPHKTKKKNFSRNVIIANIFFFNYNINRIGF